MPTSLELGLKYTCRKVNRVRHALEMRTNGTRHDITNTNHLRGEKEEEGRGFKRVHNPMGKAKPLNLLNIIAWLISTCSHPCPFCLRLGDRALAPCVYIQSQRKETSKQAI